jgi:hypothetical protein
MVAGIRVVIRAALYSMVLLLLQGLLRVRSMTVEMCDCVTTGVTMTAIASWG